MILENMVDSMFAKRNLLWLESVKIKTVSYRMSASTGSSLFTTCFALFLLDLFKVTDNFNSEERFYWISYIKQFQDKERGYFEPSVYYLADRDRSRYQLTCFALSAMKILGCEPDYPLSFIDQWRTPEDIYKYLMENGCHLGKSGSGNKAMFLAIFLTWLYERTRREDLKDMLDAWFDFHNRYQNCKGFWGRSLSNHSYHGFQNGVHQMLVYFYWNRPVPRLESIVDIVLSLQDYKGFFAPTPGGRGCWDYDAVHILANALRYTSYKKNAILNSLLRTEKAIFSEQNKDGGFCESKETSCHLSAFLKSFPFFFQGTFYPCFYRIMQYLIVVIKQKKENNTGWVERGIPWSESDIWSTWLRCLTLAEIEVSRDAAKLSKYNFHKTIGIGNFHNG